MDPVREAFEKHHGKPILGRSEARDFAWREFKAGWQAALSAPPPEPEPYIYKYRNPELAASETPKAQAGTWTLTAPDGRTWQADSPLRCVGMESKERVPAQVALARLVRGMDEDAASPPPNTQSTGT